MTTEEKAKAYDEALKKIQPLYEQAKKDDNPIWSTYEYLFPKLRESEDERIRKDIIAFLQSMNSHCDPAQDWDLRNRWLPYLEKQKEQKPAEWKPLPESMEALLLAIEGKWDAIKPTGYMSRRLEDLYDGLVNTFDVDEKYLGNLPKTEYTEKDIEEIKALKEKIDSSMETKPAEWSERDEKILASAMSHIADSQCFDHFHDISKEDIYTWLKSLRPRPHWKPSEEQMDALNSAVSNATPQTYATLSKLCNDLNKLMEE